MVFSSSIHGDTFEGAEGSTLYIDEEFNLSIKEKEEFINLVSENWNLIISESNEVLIREKEKLIPINLSIPDYTKLPERL